MRTAALAALFLALFAVPDLQSAMILELRLSTVEVRRYETITARFSLSRTYANPFDPAEVTADALIGCPDGTTLVVPAFWYRSATRSFDGAAGAERIALGDSSGWMARFTPRAAGNYTLRIRASDRDGTDSSDALAFLCLPSDGRGFLQSRRDFGEKYLRFDNGDEYHPVGMNLAWADARGTYQYDTLLARLSAENANWTRVWMTDFFQGQTLEADARHPSGWYEGVGRYSQQGAWKLDYILEAARAGGLCVQLVFQQHGQFSTTVDPQWDRNPYNAVNGGPLASPWEFITNDTAKALFKRKLRYIVARYGHLPNVIWELWNEPQFTDNYNEGRMADWHAEMAAEIRRLDPYPHAITTSPPPDHDLIWSLQDIDCAQIHLYGNVLTVPVKESIEAMRKYGKPVIVGECGRVAHAGDREGIHIHNAIWVAALCESGAMPWWWDSYIEANNLFFHFGAAAAFVRDAEVPPSAETLDERPLSAPRSHYGVMVVPVLGWVPTLKTSFAIGLDGIVPGQDSLSSFLQGAAHRTWGREWTFELTLTRADSLEIDVAETSPSAAAELTIFLDDNGSPFFVRTVAGPQKIKLALPGGHHRVRFRNTGEDWMRITGIAFMGFDLPAARVLALTDRQTRAWIWVQDRDHEYGLVANGLLSGIQIANPFLLPARVQIEIIDPWTGAFVERVERQLQPGDPLTLPDFRRDIAVRMTVLTQPTAVRPPIADAVEIGEAFPNPAHGSVVSIPMRLERARYLAVTMYDASGREIGRPLEGALFQEGRGQLNVTVADLPPGPYFARIEHESGSVLRRIIVAR